MSYILDTNVISALSPLRSPDPALAAWVVKNQASIYLTAITIAEIERGIHQLQRTGATAKSAKLRQWLTFLRHLYADHILPFDESAAIHAGVIFEISRAFSPGFADVAIGAIAQSNGMMLLTENTKDFAPMKIAILNPFKDPLP